MNLTRGEPFTIEVLMEINPAYIEALELCLQQRGRTVLRKKLKDAEFAEDGRSAYFSFSGMETAGIKSGDPVFAQARALCVDGENLHSEVEEINVLDLIGAGKEAAWG